MRQLKGSWRLAALAGAFAVIGAAQAQTQPQANGDSTVAPAVKAKQASEIRSGEPARWHKDDPTRQARLQTLHKEIGAAYAEAKKACGGNPAAERSACLKEARATYEQDMKNAPSQLDMAPGGSVQTTVQTTTQGKTQTTTTQTTH